MATIIDVQGLHKQYNPPDGPVAVNGVSFEVHAGEIFSLLGPNGAGKTTLLSMLSCLRRPTSGDALVDGYSITTECAGVKRAIGVVPQEIALYTDITGRNNLSFWGKMYGLGGDFLTTRIETVLDIVGLTEHADRRVDTYSGGMQRRLNIAVGLLPSPKILFLDEPTVGIDPQSRRRILDVIQDLNAEGLTVLYTTHYMEEAEELSHRIGILDHGELIALGTLDELTKIVDKQGLIGIETESLDADHTADVEVLEQLATVRHVYRNDGHIMLEVDEAADVLAEVIDRLAHRGTPIKSIKIQEPNLEAVFLHLTGRTLRDSTE